MKQRLEWVDTLKGIGILSVVATHIYGGGIREFLGIFSMPLFFFPGGFLYSPKYGYKEYFNRKLIHLIVPYASFIILLYPIQLLTILPQKENLSLIDILKLILNPLIGGVHLWGLTTAFWFLTCLFITQQIANFLIHKFSRRQLIYWIVFFLALSYLNYLVFPKLWLPHNANVALAATPMFLVGFLFQKHQELRQCWFISVPCVIASLLIIIWRAQQTSPDWVFIASDMKRANYGIPGITLLLALGLVLFWIDISKFLTTRLPWVCKFLTLSGQASLVILCLHMAFIYALKALDKSVLDFNLFLFSTLLSLVSYWIILRFRVTRALFLGNYSDFEQLVLKSSKSRASQY